MLDIKTALRLGQYLSVIETTDQVVNAMNLFGGVQPFTDYFKLNNGNPGEYLVGLDVHLRITLKRASFTILVIIWLPKNYPVGIPTICVQPSDCRQISKAVFHINKNGQMSNYILDVQDHLKPSNLVELIDLLCAKLSYKPHLYHEPPISPPKPLPEPPSSPVPSDPRRGVLRKTGCLICFKPLIQGESWRMLDPAGLVKKCKMLRGLCYHMMFLHQDQIPEVISEEMFPFCKSCEQLVETLWESQETIRQAHSKIAEVAHNIEKKVVECHVPAPVPPTLKEKRFIKFRDFIYEDYQKKMGLTNHLNKNHHQHDSTNSLAESKDTVVPAPTNEASSSSSTASGDNDKDEVDSKVSSVPSPPCPPMPILAPVPSPKVEEDLSLPEQDKEPFVSDFHLAPVKIEVDLEEQTSFETDIEFYNDPFFEEAHAMVKIEINEEPEEEYLCYEENASADESEDERFFGHSNGVQSLNAEVSLPIPIESDVTMSEGTLLVNGCVDIYWIRAFRKDQDSITYLKCSICQHQSNMTSEEKGMEEGFKNMEEHVLNSHKQKLEEMILRFGTREPHPCPWSGCPILFADIESRDKHEGSHRTCDKCGKLAGRNGNSEKQNRCALLLHKRSHDNPKTVKRKGEGGGGKTVGRKKTKKSF
ncbi:unnamed protein product [Orchesella dallaii]|uniref:UEV domain-containing protein n=1 Tax=Orchesella dallaii TaxID=48710 RepID=A0ABP1RPS1_9HEXA